MCTGSSSKTSLPSWLTSGAENLFQSNLKFLNQPYQPAPYLGSTINKALGAAGTPGKMVAPLNPMQKTGFAALSNLYHSGTDTSAADSARSLVDRGVGEMDPSQTQKWMNPYVQNTLDPTIRNINQQEAQQNQNLNASAISANAFGDFRHGVLGGEIAKNADQAIGDASGQAYSNAWMSALQSQQAAASNMFQGAQEGYGIYSADQQRQMGNIQALLQGGQARQQQSQNQLDARNQLWQQSQQSPYDKLAAAMSLLTGVGSVAPKTTSQDTGMGGLLGLLGSFAGGFMG
jgi:hypothetical protein